MSSSNSIKRLALVVGGGPAPGINGVISAVTIEAISHDIEVFGIQDGYRHLVKGRKDHIRQLFTKDVTGIFNKGGSILGTARTNPTVDPKDMEAVLGVFADMGFDALVSIGGDDTAYTASRVYEAGKGKYRVAHVPKTIDNDLPLSPSQPTFGFETARHVGVGIMRNLQEDARTTSRWYLIISMGRAAGHLALGIGKASSSTLTIIPEEFCQHITLDHLCDIIIGSIIKRGKSRSSYGVVVLAEGLIETVGEDNLRKVMYVDGKWNYGKLVRDEHKHLRLGEIEFARMVKDRLAERLKVFDKKMDFIDKDLGYELRCADPVPFDVEYTRDLGYGAVKFLRGPDSSKFGAVISLVEGKLEPKPFQTMLDPETKKMATRSVNVHGEGYEAARRYMIRLERSDFEDPRKLKELADYVGLTPDEFRARFEYIITSPAVVHRQSS